MKGSILFNKDINIEVDVDPAADEGAKLTSAVNLVDGQELGVGGSDLPEVTAADNGKVLSVVNGEWAADDKFIFIDNDDDMVTLGVTPRQVLSAIANHKIILVCSLGNAGGQIHLITQVLEGQFVDPEYTGKYITVITEPNGNFVEGMPVITGSRYIADTLDDIFTFD